MADTMSDPTRLTYDTTLRPTHPRTVSASRSPSRSPVRKAQFNARELDPLLRDLSPEAILRVLQQTGVIGSDSAKDAYLGRSIEGTSEEERKLGIRAALAGQKIRQWLHEINAWWWPKPENCRWGAAFLPPSDQDEHTEYFGCLSRATVQQYSDRIDDIVDAIEELGIQELQNYMLVNLPNPHSPQLRTLRANNPGHVYLRDLTAVISASVMDMLPIKAILDEKLNLWRGRLDVLVLIPQIDNRSRLCKIYFNDAMNTFQDLQKSRTIDATKAESAKTALKYQINLLSRLIKKARKSLLDPNDLLPQAYIDSLEDLDNKYDEFVTRADQLIEHNQRLSTQEERFPSGPDQSAFRASTGPAPLSVQSMRGTDPAFSPADHNVPSPQHPSWDRSIVDSFPVPTASTGQNQTHRRGVSEVSAVDSTFSIENAEIMNAQRASIISHNHIIDPTDLTEKEAISDAPVVPRRSSKRVSMYQPTLDDKIRDILNKLPTEAKLLEESSDNSSRSSSRSSTQASSPPTIKISPVKKGRSSYDPTTGIRVYNLTQPGSSRKTPPKQLFVRAVGEHGDRVMVRVGGGWADLAEYLHEYSLHHGGRTLAEQNLNVVPMPDEHSKFNTRDGNQISSNTPTSDKPLHNRSLRDSGFDFGLSRNDSTSRRRARFSEDQPQIYGQSSSPPERPLPVPHQPDLTKPHGTSSDRAQLLSSNPHPTPRDTPQRLPGATLTPTAAAVPVVSTTSTITPVTPQNNPNYSSHGYTPLGAAGPVSSATRRTAGAGAGSTNSPATHTPRIETLVGNGTITTINYGPTMSTTTTITSSSPSSPSPFPRSTKPVARHIPAPPHLTPAPLVASPRPMSPALPPTKPAIQNSLNPPNPSMQNPEKRNSLLGYKNDSAAGGGASGIKRVFLRSDSKRRFY